MNKFLIFGLLLAMVSCGKQGEPQTENSSLLKEPAVATTDSAIAGNNEGLALIEGADCMTCHKKDSKLIGPSFQEIADRYTAADANMLASKIIDGSQGVWGQVPMTAHAGMSKETATKMVEYILTLKK